MKLARIVAGELLAVPPVAARVTEGNDRLLSLLLADRTLTTEEWAEIEAAETAAGPVEHFPALLTAIDRLHPLAASKLVDRIIERLDVDQGDIDLEDGDEDRCPSFDDAPIRDAIARDQMGYEFFGPNPDEDAEDDDPAGGAADDEGEREEGVAWPRYAIDQSAGPIDEIAAAYERRRALVA